MDNQSKLVFIDFETFNVNLNFFSNRPWQVGMLKVEDGAIKDSFDEMLRWDSDLKISKEAARITGYNQFVFDKKARPEKEVFQTVYDWLDDSDYIVGHNIVGLVHTHQLSFLILNIECNLHMYYVCSFSI